MAPMPCLPPVRRWCVPGAVALATLALLAVPAAVQAHPFGPPPRAWLEVDGDVATLSWEAAYDDYLALGEHLGELEPGTSAAYVDPSVQVAPPRADVEELVASDRLRDYVMDNIVVTQDGEPCRTEQASTQHLVEQGAWLRVRCPAPVASPTIRITMLHDVNEAYRTFGLIEDGEPGPFAIFSVEQPEHEVDIEAIAGAGDGQARAVLLGAVAVLAVGVPVAFRRLTRDGGS